MSKGVVWVALLNIAIATGWAEPSKEGKPETLVHWEFAGSKQLSALKELTVLQELMGLPQTGDLREAAVKKLSGLAASHFTKPGETNPNPAAVSLIQPLLADAVQSESRLELTAQGAKDADWIFAIRNSGEGAELWDKNLSELAKLAGMQVQRGKDQGWSATLQNYRFAFSRTKDWVVLEGGLGAAPAESKLFKSFRSGLSKKSKEIVDLQVNFPVLAKIWSAPSLGHMPKVSLTVAPRKNALRTEAQIDYPSDLKITAQKWNIPEPVIRDPLIAFTAIQGVKDALSRSELVKMLAPAKIPNDLYFWSLDEGYFAIFGAADVGNPPQVITNVLTKLIPTITNSPGGTITALTNRAAVLWRGLPIIVPFLEQGPEGAKSVLVGGLFPINGYGTNRAPAELFSQLKQKNLIYYDWELSAPRMMQWRVLWQLTKVLKGEMLPPQVSEKWFEAAIPKLGNSVTEATLENPQRIKMVRTSSTGFSSLELVLLAHLTDQPAPPDAPKLPGPKKAPGPSPARPQPAARPTSP